MVKVGRIGCNYRFLDFQIATYSIRFLPLIDIKELKGQIDWRRGGVRDCAMCLGGNSPSVKRLSDVIF